MSAPTVPYAFPAERATLGAIFRDPRAIEGVAEWLKPEHFGLESHAWVYEAMLAAHAQRTPPDRIAVAQLLERAGRLSGLAGGELFLIELMAEVPHAAHIEAHARIVEDTAIRRRIIQAGGAIAAAGYETSRQLEDVATTVEAELSAALAGRTRAEKAVKIGAVLSPLAQRLTEAQGRGGLTGLSTGYPDMDALTGGLQPSDLIILAARPGFGKTSLAMCLAYNAALFANRDHTGQITYLPNRPVGVFSLEMSREQLTQRLLAMHTGVDMQRLRTGNLRDDELNLVFAGMGDLNEAPIYLDDTPGLSIRDLQRRARRLHAETNVSLLLIDYLQLMAGGKAAENRVQEVSEISRGLKALARELNIPVVALSQLSRAVEGRQSKVPMLSDLRESGSLEQDADIVLFIYREEKYDPKSDKPGIAEIHFAKHRNGPTGVVELRFEARTTRFYHIDRYQGVPGYED